MINIYPHGIVVANLFENLIKQSLRSTKWILVVPTLHKDYDFEKLRIDDAFDGWCMFVSVW